MQMFMLLTRLRKYEEKVKGTVLWTYVIRVLNGSVVKGIGQEQALHKGKQNVLELTNI